MCCYRCNRPRLIMRALNYSLILRLITARFLKFSRLPAFSHPQPRRPTLVARRPLFTRSLAWLALVCVAVVASRCQRVLLLDWLPLFVLNADCAAVVVQAFSRQVGIGVCRRGRQPLSTRSSARLASVCVAIVVQPGFVANAVIFGCGHCSCFYIAIAVGRFVERSATIFLFPFIASPLFIYL